MSDPKTAPQQTHRKPQDKRLSPLQLCQHNHCNHCDRHCTPASEGLLACVLCDLVDTIRRNNQLNKYRGAHL